MTGITITFVSDNIINIANATGNSVTFEISKLLPSGLFDTKVDQIVGSADNEDYSFSEDGIYKVWNPTAVEGNIIIVIPDILDELEIDVKEILLSDNLKKELPIGYDFVNLVLLSIAFIGNSAFQNVLYVAGLLTDYTVIATAIDRTSKYLNKQGNTIQSSNQIWQ